MSISTKVQEFLARKGLYVQLKPPKETRRRIALLQHLSIDTVLDVGANRGQYAEELIAYGYLGRIHSYEPLSAVFPLLEQRASQHKNWYVHQLALGADAGTSEINISQNSHSSSIREILPKHLAGAPDSVFVAKETISLSTIDQQIADLKLSEKNVYLKIDTQGYEREVLKGSLQSIARIKAIQIEISLASLYDQGMGLDECTAFMAEHGLRLVGLEPGFYNPETGELLQVDGVFIR